MWSKWCHAPDSDSENEDCSLAEVKESIEHIVIYFRLSLEAKGVSECSQHLATLRNQRQRGK